MLRLYYLDVNIIDDKKSEDLSKYRLDKVNNFKFEKDKKLSLAAGILLDQGLNQIYNLKEKDMEIGLSEYGKPYIKNYPDIHFNISHTSKMSICVFSSSIVGCDIETIREYDQLLVNRCFSSIEKEYIKKSKNKNKAFTRIWLHKEAFLKCIGIGLNKKMNQISIIIKNNNISVDQNIYKGDFIIQERKIKDYLVSICYKKED